MLHSFHHPQAAERHTRVVAGRIDVVFTDEATDSSGPGWATADGGQTGEIDLVFDTPISELLSLVATIEKAGATVDAAIRVLSWTASTRTAVLAVVKSSTGAADDTDCTINFVAFFRSQT